MITFSLFLQIVLFQLIILLLEKKILIFKVEYLLQKVSNETWRNIDKNKYKNLDIEFWTYTDAGYLQDTYVDKEKHIIYVKRKHNFEDSIGFYQTFSKTIYAIQEINKMGIKYDYLLRTNNSTWINIPLINEFLSWQNDDSLIFTGRIYSSFWSAFNLYAGGELMIFSKRNMDLLVKLAENPEEKEQKIPGCDDNLLFGLWNKRLLDLKLRESKYLHSLEDDLFINKTLPNDIDFTKIAYQVKTYNVSDEERIIFDVNKMKQIDNMWRNNNELIEDLYNKFITNNYDKYIYVIPYSKQEWFRVPEQEQHMAKFRNRQERKTALEYCSARQVQLGYYKAKI